MTIAHGGAMVNGGKKVIETRSYGNDKDGNPATSANPIIKVRAANGKVEELRSKDVKKD